MRPVSVVPPVLRGRAATIIGRRSLYFHLLPLVPRELIEIIDDSGGTIDRTHFEQSASFFPFNVAPHIGIMTRELVGIPFSFFPFFFFFLFPPSECEAKDNGRLTRHLPTCRRFLRLAKCAPYRKDSGISNHICPILSSFFLLLFIPLNCTGKDPNVSLIRVILLSDLLFPLFFHPLSTKNRRDVKCERMESSPLSPFPLPLLYQLGWGASPAF